MNGAMKKIEVLVKHYGEPKTVFMGEVGEPQPPMVDTAETYNEWAIIKELTIDCSYSTGNMSALWQIIGFHHGDSFPNLIKLAQLALALPVHTADCERGFSAQNHIKTALRSRLKSERVDNLMLIKIEGAHWKNFDYPSALAKFQAMKNRRVYQKS